MKKGSIEKVLVFKNKDGSIGHIIFLRSGMLIGETDDQYFERQTQELKNKMPSIGAANLLTMTKDNFREVLKNEPSGSRRRLRLDVMGKLFVDHNIKLPDEREQELVQSVRTKLKSGQPLNDNDIDFLLDGKK